MQENYQKRSYRNRCILVGSNGTQLLSVPLLKGKNQQTSIRDVKVSYDMPWVSSHLNTIKSCYGSAPYFAFIFEGIEEILRSKPKYLVDLNIKVLFNILNFLDLDLAIASSVFFDRNANTHQNDYRNVYLPTSFSKNTLNKNKIMIPEYQQLFIEKHGFIPNVSILDLLFCLGPESTTYLNRIKNNDLCSISQSN